MAESKSGSDLFNDLAHEFAERYRRGERPSLSEYADRYPDLAGEIRELFPALVMMERIGSDADPHEGTVEDRPRRRGPMPERLGDYRILREIGRGGMGIVYEAMQESLGRRVALKVLSRDRLLGPTALIRFRREARAAALLHHTNIVPVFGVGEHEGVPYYAMQYIEGRSLDVVLRQLDGARRESVRTRPATEAGSGHMPAGPHTGLLTRRYAERSDAAGAGEIVPPPATETGGSDAEMASSPSSIPVLAELQSCRKVARMAMQAAEALAHAHAYGVVHRDIKPSNLLLDVQGTLWVTDFGLAKAEGNDELTSPGDVVGTLRYLAPERFVGKADARSDIYSLGLTLYEMLTLEPAFRSSHRAQLTHAILHDEPARPRRLDRRIPRDLETIVLKAIAKDPADRFADAGEMAAELGRFVEGLPIRSRRLAIPERIWRWSRRNPALARVSLLAAALTTALLIGSVAAAWTYREQRDAVAANLARALEAERQQKAELGRSLLLQARAVRYSGQPGRRSDGLEILASSAKIARDVGSPPEHLAGLRDEVIAALALADDRPVRTWSGLDLPGERSACSIEADRYVVIGPRGVLQLHRLSDPSQVRVLGADRPAARLWPVFVPGGRFLTIAFSRSPPELWDLERGEVPVAWPADVRCVASRIDGRQVAALRPGGELRVYDLPAMTEASRCRLDIDVPTTNPGPMDVPVRGRPLPGLDPGDGCEGRPGLRGVERPRRPRAGDSPGPRHQEPGPGPIRQAPGRQP